VLRRINRYLKKKDINQLDYIVIGWELDSDYTQAVQLEEWVVGYQPECCWMCEGGSRALEDDSKL
jgi:hypothetical protein